MSDKTHEVVMSTSAGSVILVVEAPAGLSAQEVCDKLREHSSVKNGEIVIDPFRLVEIKSPQ